MSSDLENPARRKSTLFLADEMIASLKESPTFWRSFKSVKLDSEDGDAADGESVVVIVAKGDVAERMSDAYAEVVKDEPEAEWSYD